MRLVSILAQSHPPLHQFVFTELLEKSGGTNAVDRYLSVFCASGHRW